MQMTLTLTHAEKHADVKCILDVRFYGNSERFCLTSGRGLIALSFMSTTNDGLCRGVSSQRVHGIEQTSPVKYFLFAALHSVIHE